MITDKRLPANYTLVDGEVLINRFHRINPMVENAMKSTKTYSKYVGNNFTANIWWEPKDGFWYAEISEKGRYQVSRKSGTIQMLAFEIDSSYGS